MRVNTLFIGGGSDGKWLEVEEGVRYFEIPIPISPEDISIHSSFATTVEFKTELYRSEQLREGEHRYTVMVSNSIPMGKVLATLINGYRKPYGIAGEGA